MDSSIFTSLLAIAGAIYFVAALISMGRMLAGPNSLDRLISMETMIAMMQGMFAAFMVWRLDTSVVYPMLVIALLGFLSSLTVAKFRVPDDRKSPDRKIAAKKAAPKSVAKKDAAAKNPVQGKNPAQNSPAQKPYLKNDILGDLGSPDDPLC